MLGRIACLVLAPALLASNRADAAPGTVSLSWDDCSPVVQDKTTTTPGSYSLFGSVQGCDVTHRGYYVGILYGDEQAQVPDAWRFDSTGCQGVSRVDLAVDATGGCPDFSQAAPSRQVTHLGFTPVFLPYSTSTMRIIVAKAYEDSVVADPSTRYFLFKATFAMDFATAGPTLPGGTCGGMERPLCFKLYVAYLIDDARIEVAMDWASHPLIATWNGGAACGAIPARATTWGAIKGQYRD